MLPTHPPRAALTGVSPGVSLSATATPYSLPFAWPGQLRTGFGDHQRFVDTSSNKTEVIKKLG